MKFLFLILLVQYQIGKLMSSKIRLKSSYQTGFDNKYETSGNVGNYQYVTIIRCLQECARNVKCMTFFFNSNQQKCILHSNTFWDKSPSVSGSGWKFYVTEDVTGRCPPNNGFVYYRQMDLCYNLNSGIQMNYNNIATRCSSKGAELIRIDSEEKNSFIMDIVRNKFVSPNTHVCIEGTNSIKPNLAWTFFDGTPMPYFNWDTVYSPRQPENRANEPRIAIARTLGTWHDFALSSSFRCLYVCEKR